MEWLNNLLGDVLAWFESWTGSYALVLLFYALILKILFLPFTVKQQKNQIKMAKIAPQIEAIKAKYKGRNTREAQQQMQQEIMEFQQKEGYSPLAGCLPMLIQLPIIMWLYGVITKPLSYIAKFTAADLSAAAEVTKYNLGKSGQIGLISSIRDYLATYGEESIVDFTNKGIALEKLNNIPNFDLFGGINLAETPSFNLIGKGPNGWLVLIPILAAVTSWLSMYLMKKWNQNPTTASADPQSQASMKMMDLMMPAMSLFISFSLSGMLGVYWIYQSLITILQTFIISRVIPMPKFTEEELKEMRKAQKAAEKAQKEALKAQPKVRSLHYIDEDDYDELPEMKNAPKPTKKNAGIEAPQIKD